MKLPNLPKQYSLTTVALILIFSSVSRLRVLGHAIWVKTMGRLLLHWGRVDRDYWDSVLRIETARHCMDSGNMYLFVGAGRIRAKLESLGGDDDFHKMGDVYEFDSIAHLMFFRADETEVFEALVRDYLFGDKDWKIVEFEGNGIDCDSLLAARYDLRNDEQFGDLISKYRILAMGNEFRHELSRILAGPFSAKDDENKFAVVELEKLGLSAYATKRDVAAPEMALEQIDQIRSIASQEVPSPNWRQSRQQPPDLGAWLGK